VKQPARRAPQVRTFLEQNLQVYGLRSAENNANGLITGYYEPVYPAA
jgi:membrane-bound lytic murein transglycosylase A